MRESSRYRKMEPGGRKEGAEVITIDGPAGAGKSTASKMLARRLNYLYLDTGAMYRAVALRVQDRKADPNDESALEDVCRQLEISFREEAGDQRVFDRGEDITEKIRAPEVGWMASMVSMKRTVREALVHLQRKIGCRGKVVAEGRDTGTVVFPRARTKIFLTADPGERARRRYRELTRKGLAVNLEEVEKEIKSRDEQDSFRQLAPLRPAEDSRIIDTTGLTPDEVVERMLEIIKADSFSQEGGIRAISRDGY
jgi:cytidylate kinase